MNLDLKPGLRFVQRVRVSEALTVPAVSQTFTGFADMPPVFATAFLVGFIEWTCIEALRPLLAPGEGTVGTHVDIGHTAATPVGMTVVAEIELVEVVGRKLRFKVSCRDDVDRIAEGVHERAIINHAKFLERVSAKAARVGHV